MADHLSRRDAAALLGFASEFKVRQLEKEGRLHAVRGAMGQAWYPRAAVLALRRDADPGRAGQPEGPRAPVAGERWTDGALVTYLREASPRVGRLPTVVDLVADTGVSIARAERVYRFWLAHDAHPAAESLRAARALARARVDAGGRLGPPGGLPEAGAVEGAPPPSSGDGRTASLPEERRGGPRRERDDLIRRLRDADPAVRAAAFEKLKKPPRGPL